MPAPTLISHAPAFQVARNAIEAVRKAGTALAFAISHEAQLIREKPVRKVDAIRRIMQAENGLTGKPHSATSAEAVVETDPEYLVYLRQSTEAVVRRELTRVELVAARLEAQLHLALLLADHEEEDE